MVVKGIHVKNKFSGKFIVLDGPDGCGKNPKRRVLKEWLKDTVVAVFWEKKFVFFIASFKLV